jgi:hypothetical protein
MADEARIQKVTRELVDALKEAGDAHNQFMCRRHGDAGKSYMGLTLRVERAIIHWNQLFHPLPVEK